MEKMCRKCGDVKDVTYFGNHKRSPDGLRSWCKACNNKNARDWTHAHPDKVLESDRQKVAKNPELYKAIKQRHYAANADRIKARSVQWAIDNPEKHRASKAASATRRRCRYRHSAAFADQTAVAEVWQQCPEGYHVDHIVPLNGELVSGLNVPWNLQYLPAADNLRKSNKWDPWEDSKSLT